jgi:hypothetical protein
MNFSTTISPDLWIVNLGRYINKRPKQKKDVSGNDNNSRIIRLALPEHHALIKDLSILLLSLFWIHTPNEYVWGPRVTAAWFYWSCSVSSSKRHVDLASLQLATLTLIVDFSFPRNIMFRSNSILSSYKTSIRERRFIGNIANDPYLWINDITWISAFFCF